MPDSRGPGQRESSYAATPLPLSESDGGKDGIADCEAKRGAELSWFGMI